MARFSRNVSSGGRSHTSCCRLPSTSAMRRLNGGPPVQGTNPAASTRPLVGYRSPASILSVVVLPAPFGPRNATISPGSIRNVTSRTACTSRYRGRRSARRAPRSPGSRTFTWNVLLNRSASTIDGMGVREIYPGTPGVWPRQLAVAGAPRERRAVVDRRRGAERRSTLERRGRPPRDPSLEGPGEHLRNALQLLSQLPFVGEPVFDAALSRLRRALELLEQRH